MACHLASSQDLVFSRLPGTDGRGRLAQDLSVHLIHPHSSQPPGTLDKKKPKYCHLSAISFPTDFGSVVDHTSFLRLIPFFLKSIGPM